MSGPYVEQTGEPGEAATMTDREYAETILADAPLIHAWSAFQEVAHRDDGELREHDGITAAFESVVPLVAALVAAAEERGAAKERERIAGAIKPTMHEAAEDTRTWRRRPEPSAHVQEARASAVAATCRTVLRVIDGEQVLGIPRGSS